MKKSKRISISLSKREYKIWREYTGDGSLSAFIRNAVNNYIKTQEPGKRSSIFDLILEQKMHYGKIKKDLERIGGDVIEIIAVLVEKGIVPEIRANENLQKFNKS